MLHGLQAASQLLLTTSQSPQWIGSKLLSFGLLKAPVGKPPESKCYSCAMICINFSEQSMALSTAFEDDAGPSQKPNGTPTSINMRLHFLQTWVWISNLSSLISLKWTPSSGSLIRYHVLFNDPHTHTHTECMYWQCYGSNIWCFQLLKQYLMFW